MLAGLEIIIKWNNRAPKTLRESTEDANIKRVEEQLKRLHTSPEIVKSAISQHFRPPLGDYPPSLRTTPLSEFLTTLRAHQQKPEPLDYESYVQVPARRYHLSKIYARLRADCIRGTRTFDEIDAGQARAEKLIEDSKVNPQVFAQIIVDYSARLR